MLLSLDFTFLGYWCLKVLGFWGFLVLCFKALVLRSSGIGPSRFQCLKVLWSSNLSVLKTLGSWFCLFFQSLGTLGVGFRNFEGFMALGS